MSYYGWRLRAPDIAAFAKFVLLTSLLALSACKSAPSSVPPESLGTIKTIGVISSVGTTLYYERIGAGGWDNDFYKVSSAPLGVDSYVVGLIRQPLAARFKVMPVEYNPTDFAPREDDTLETVAARIRTAAQPANLDAYLLVLPGNSASKSSGHPLDFSSQQINGLGLTRKSWLTNHDYWAHALYVLVMVDGRSGKILSETAAAGGYQDLDFLEMPAMGGPYRNVAETVWPEDPQHPTQAAVTALVEGTLKPLLAESLQPTLKAAKLIP